jgi:hypothetical protein
MMVTMRHNLPHGVPSRRPTQLLARLAEFNTLYDRRQRRECFQLVSRRFSKRSFGMVAPRLQGIRCGPMRRSAPRRSPVYRDDPGEGGIRRVARSCSVRARRVLRDAARSKFLDA